MFEIGSKSAPKPRKRLQVKQAHDADRHAGNLSNWSQQYDQTSCGAFIGEIAELSLTGLQVFREYTNQALQQKCMVWPNSLWMGLPLPEQSACRINGLPIEPLDIMSQPGNQGFELSTPKNYSLYGMVIDANTLLDFAQTHHKQLDWQKIKSQGRFTIPRQTINNVRYVLRRVLDQSYAPLHSEKWCRELLMMCILELISQEEPQLHIESSYRKKKQTVDSAREYITRHVGQPITLTDLCRHSHVSQRTLHYNFKTILGISPIHYLRIARLNEVRRRLTHCTLSENIFDIASQWGFWHMSQFAKDYKTLFGESPSATKLKATQWA